MPHNLTVDILGWVGAILILIAYGLISARKVDSRSRLYQGLNVIGSACLIVNGVYYRAYPSAFVNVVWILIAVYTLSLAFRKRPEQ